MVFLLRLLARVYGEQGKTKRDFGEDSMIFQSQQMLAGFFSHSGLIGNHLLLVACHGWGDLFPCPGADFLRAERELFDKESN